MAIPRLIGLRVFPKRKSARARMPLLRIVTTLVS
jgi:hypothetical protein